jgi:hypothetical protein
MKSQLTFELSKNTDEVFVFANSEGLRFLAAKLHRLADQADAGNLDHEHLMTQEWAGNELGSIAQGVDTQLINHVKICTK